MYSFNLIYEYSINVENNEISSLFKTQKYPNNIGISYSFISFGIYKPNEVGYMRYIVRREIWYLELTPVHSMNYNFESKAKILACFFSIYS